VDFVTRPTARVLALLEILQAGGGFTVSDLAGRLGVDERTVRRYAAHLADLGVPVEARRGRYGGYRLAPGYKLPPLMLTDDEAVAVVLGLVAGRRAGLVTAESAATEFAATEFAAREFAAREFAATESAIAKVRRVLPATLARRIDALLSTVDFTAPPRRSAPPGVDVLLVLADAAQRRQPVTIAYTSWRGRASERGLNPYGLVFHAGRWYVTGHDHASGSVRTFRLDRIATARLAAGSFDLPAGFDPAAQVISGLAAVPYAHEVSVVLHTGLAEARSRIPPSVGTLTEVPGGVRLDTRAERLDGAARLLAGLGWPFTIDRPDELKTEVRALAAALLRYAEATGADPSRRRSGGPPPDRNTG
jgi:predicted DNA-binding transcriptional regulator YafY